MRTGVIVQMRLDSSRLPQKALLPLAGSTIADKVLSRLKALAVDEYILATAIECKTELEPIAQRNNYKLFLGSKDDVLQRYVKAAEEYNLELIVRATGDNPLVSVFLAQIAIKEYHKLINGRKADYVGLLGMPSGMGVEVVSYKALKRAMQETNGSFFHEHVCPYLYQNADLFDVRRPYCPKEYLLPNCSVSIDTQEDYDFVKKLFASCGENPSDMEVIKVLRQQKAL